MKLNNKGWGLGAFFGFSLIVVIAIIIASIKSYNFGLNNDDSSNIIFNDSSTYIKLENNLMDAGRRYAEASRCKYDNNVCYVSYNELKSLEYINNLSDNNFNKCSGYVKIIGGNSHTYNAYIKCGNSYQTTGYTSEFDK